MAPADGDERCCERGVYGRRSKSGENADRAADLRVASKLSTAIDGLGFAGVSSAIRYYCTVLPLTPTQLFGRPGNKLFLFEKSSNRRLVPSAIPSKTLTVDFIGKFRPPENPSYRHLSAVVTKSRHRFTPGDIDRRQDCKQEIPSRIRITQFCLHLIKISGAQPNRMRAIRRRPQDGEISRTFGK